MFIFLYLQTASLNFVLLLLNGSNAMYIYHLGF